MIRKGFIWIFILACFHLNALAQEMVFSAQASSQQVGIKDQFQVTFVLTNAEGASNFRPPSFSGFSIVGGPYQSNNSSITIINGQTRQTNSLNITYVLVPNKTGLLTVSPAKVTYNGHDVASNPVNVQIVNGSLAQQQRRRQSMDPFGDEMDDPFAQMQKMRQQMMQQMSQAQQSRRQQAQQQVNDLQSMSEENINKNIFIKVQVDKTDPHVGEQITVSYKLYTRLAMNVSLSQLPSLNGFWSQDFQIPSPPKPVEEVINGQRYQVFLLKKTALFPQQDGALVLDPAKAEGVVRVVQQVKGRNPFADDPAFGSFFMDDPFFNQDMFSGYNYKDVPVKLSSAPVKINVKPLPPDKQPASFTGAVGNFTVSAQLDKHSLSTDDAANFVFTIKGSGNLKLIGNPKIEFPAELGVYEPQVTDTITSRNPAITGSKIFSYNMNPQTPGDYVIPGVKFSYYDAATGSYKESVTEPIKVHVTKGKHYNPNIAKANAIKDIHDINKSAFVPQSDAKPIATRPWYWMLYGLSLTGLIVLLMRRKQQEVYEGNQALFKNKKANKIAWKRLATARKLLPQQQHKAFYEEVSKAIWLYLSDKLSIPLSHLSKETVEDELMVKHVPHAQINRVKSLVLECEMALYSPSGGQQQRQHTLDEAAGTIGELEAVLKNKKNAVQYTSVFCAVIMMGMGLQAFAANNDAALWQQANQLYTQKNYESAAGIYESLLKGNDGNARLHYNAGNAYYRLNKIGLAVLHYEKAAHLEPSNKEINDNLLLAKSKVQDNMQETNPIFFVAWWNALNHAVSVDTWAILSLIVFLAVLSLLYVARVKKENFPNAGRWISLSIVVLLLCGSMAWISYNEFADPGKAVVTSTNAVFLQSPQGNGKVIGSLPEGLVIEITGKQNGFYNVVLQNGKSGWVAAAEIGEI